MVCSRTEETTKYYVSVIDGVSIVHVWYVAELKRLLSITFLLTMVCLLYMCGM